MNRLIRIWYSRNFVSGLLIPLALIYQLIIAIRQYCYRLGIKKTTHFPVPVIVVGNLTVGGTGKTPLVIKLAEFLREQGYRPGIVSRVMGEMHRNSTNRYACQ